MNSKLKISEQSLSLYQPGGNPPITLINFNDFFGNLGAVPLHSFYENTVTIPSIFRNIVTEYHEKFSDMEQALDIVSITLTICFLIKQSMSRFKPWRILEIGCQHGSLSYFITKTACLIHPDSKVFCLSEVLPGQGFMKILTELGDGVANLNLLTTSKESSMLRDDYFDFVVINGSEFMENPAGIITNAVRIVQPGGRLLCLTYGQYLLKSCFAAYINGYDEYFVTDNSSVLVKVIGREDKELLENPAKEQLCAKMRNLNSEVCRVVDDVSAAATEELAGVVDKLSQMEDIAIELFVELDDMDLKHVLSCVKECVLDYIYTSDPSYKEKCGQKLRGFAATLRNYNF